MDFDNGIRTAKDQGDDQGKRVDFGLFADELHVCMCVRAYLYSIDTRFKCTADILPICNPILS